MPKFKTAMVVAGDRDRTEDRAEVIEFGEARILILADGAGGRPGGAEAAESVIRSVREAVIKAKRLPDAQEWCRILQESDQSILNDPIAGETTAIAVSVSASGIAGASVGDSGAWLITTNSFIDLTEDQNRKPFLGRGSLPTPFETPLLSGTLLVASDGLLKYADAAQICTIARQPDLDAAAKQLIESVRLPSGALWDDVSVILCRPILSGTFHA